MVSKIKEKSKWIKTAEDTAYKISICTGSFVIGAAEFLREKTATTNFKAYKLLEKYCKTVSTKRIVDDKNTITVGAVSASIDLGLYICEKLIGTSKTEEIRKNRLKVIWVGYSKEYRPNPV